MIGKIVLFLSALALAGAQIPSLGFCPEYVPMANFDMTKVNAILYPYYRRSLFFFSSISRRDRSNREFNSFILFLPSQFLGVWYEAERYFQLTEVVSRCVMANYTLGADGKFRVSNEVTNRL